MSFLCVIYVILCMKIDLSVSSWIGIPAEPIFCILFIEERLRAPNVDIKGQYFTINVNFRNNVAITNTLTIK